MIPWTCPHCLTTNKAAHDASNKTCKTCGFVKTEEVRYPVVNNGNDYVYGAMAGKAVALRDIPPIESFVSRPSADAAALLWWDQLRLSDKYAAIYSWIDGDPSHGLRTWSINDISDAEVVRIYGHHLRTSGCGPK